MFFAQLTSFDDMNFSSNFSRPLRPCFQFSDGVLNCNTKLLAEIVNNACRFNVLSHSRSVWAHQDGES